MARRIWAFLALASIAIQTVTSIKVYESYDSQYHCFRRMNLTHQIGCSSAGIGSNYGIAHSIEASTRDKDLEFITHSGEDAPYTAVISSSLLKDFDLFVALQKAKSARVSGILILEDDNNTLSAFSSDRSCPNIGSSFYTNTSEHYSCKSQEWNKPTSSHSEGLMFIDFPFPIYIIKNDTQIASIQGYLAKHSRKEFWPKLAIELTSSMVGAQNSETCLRKSRMATRGINLSPELFCDPLGGFNLFKHNIDSEHSNQPVVMLAARQDSFSIFDQIAPGGDSALTSVVALLATIETLHRDDFIRDKIDAGQKRLMFSLFDGEAWDYIGSGETVHKLFKNDFHLSDFSNDARRLGLQNISLVIELNQLAAHNKPMDLFLHGGDSGTQTQDFLNVIRKQAANVPELSVRTVDTSKPIPPGSTHSFLKKSPRDADGKLSISAIAVTNHEAEYSNKFYNSFRDNITVDDAAEERLAHIVDLMSRSMYRLATGNDPANDFPKANATLVGQLLECFLVNSNCALFRSLPGVDVKHERSRPPFSSYVSVYGIESALRQFTLLTMNKFTARPVKADSSEKCKKYASDNHLQCHWRTETCSCSNAYRLLTVSPAVDPQTYELVSENLADYAVWTESKWHSSTLRLFVVSSPGYRLSVIFIGIAVLVISIVANYLFNRHFCDLFCIKQQVD